MFLATTKPIPFYVSLCLCGALSFGCASSDDSDKKDKKTEINPITVYATPTTSEFNTASSPPTVVSPEHAAPRLEKVAAANTAVDAAELDLEPPSHSIFYFGFDQTELHDGDLERLIEHARFMQTNPELVLIIDGHSDYHGARTYNELLSKKRAEMVAGVLIDAGIPPSRLIVNGLADDKPFECKRDTRHNRRVELHYLDHSLAIKQ